MQLQHNDTIYQVQSLIKKVQPMPKSSVRKKKPANAEKINSGRQTKFSAYIEDFMDEVVSVLPDGEFGLVSVLTGPDSSGKEGEKHYYVISRGESGKLLEHNEGPEFIRNFTKAVTKPGMTPTKIIVGYFDPAQVNIVGEGIDFKTPYVALQWVAGKDSFLPDNSFFNWNGCLVQPGGEIARYS